MPMKQPKKEKYVSYSSSETFFDDCEICRAMKQAEEQGQDLSLEELKKVFATANLKRAGKDKNDSVH